MAREIIEKQEILTEFLFDKNINKNIIDTYGTINFPSKEKHKNVLIITSLEHKNFFTEIKHDKLSSIEITSLDELDLFSNVQAPKFLLSRICEKIVKKYDFIIIHLLGDVTDNYTQSKEHNFLCSIIAGIMRGFKEEIEENKVIDYYLAHEKNIKPDLRCSDVDPISRYTKPEEISDKINKIIDKIV